ncbi:MAG: ATP-binding cassette domain-containing protein [Spirochaetaceae bacterium]|jgi:ABC-type multidrug transport system ATPase subunit|nr:ATP-binding cassette domain-containing protein [Spirochaetaceae bacterium]
MGEPVIELSGVSFFAQNMLVVRDFSYRYNEGKTTALVGPSGSGKSTVLKLSAGVLVPSQGEVCYRGKNIAAMNRSENLAFRREAAVVFQDSALWANQDVYQSLELPLRLHFPSMDRDERNRHIAEVLAEVGYKRDIFVRPSLLSMGEQKLVAFARAMLCRPRLIYLDEWTESLDDDSARRLIGIVRKLREKETTIILVSHDLRIIKALADYVLMILGGQLFMEFTREHITEDEDLLHMLEDGIEA